MSYTLYDSSVVLAKNAVESLSGILQKAAAHENASSLPSATLYEDMLPLGFQVFMVTDTAQKLVARTSGTEPLQLENNLTTFEAMQARIDQVLEVLNKADKDIINSRVDEMVTIGLGPGKSADVKVREFVGGYAMPNIFFHVSTAYAILRKEGVPLGKMDFLNAFFGKYIS